MGSSVTLLYILLEALRNVKSNLLTTLFTIVTLGLSLAIFTVFVIVLTNLSTIIKTWGGKIQVVAYLKDGTSQAEVARMTERIGRLKGVEKVNYISKKRALDILKEDLKGYGGILDGITTNPLPPSFEIKVKPSHRNTGGVNRIVDKLRDIKGIEDIQYGQRWVERFSAVLGFIKLFAVVIGVFLGAATLFIISNTIRLTVYARRDEIEVARLVGASDGYIKVPFILEGVFQGFIGGLLATCLLYSIRYLLSRNIPTSFLTVVEIPFSLPVITVSLVVAGIFLGISGGMISLGRFLKPEG
ncbi:MAG: permease-like cell division protein FtsX [Thermodesulfobacteriota bacterium]